jgi:hypothetical protein
MGEPQIGMSEVYFTLIIEGQNIRFIWHVREAQLNWLLQSKALGRTKDRATSPLSNWIQHDRLSSFEQCHNEPFGTPVGLSPIRK